MAPQAQTTLCRLLVVTLAVGIGCGREGPAPAGRASSDPARAWPACVVAEYGDGHSGVREFRFDGEGNIVAIVNRDNRGALLSATRIEWSADAVAEHAIDADAGVASSLRAALGHGTLGSHGELLAWHVSDPSVRIDTTLAWTGQFALGSPRASFETPYLGLLPLFVSLDTRDRTFMTRMRPFVFTGTVAIRETKTREGKRRETSTEVLEVDYREGRLWQMRSEKFRTTAKWNAAELLEVVSETPDGTLTSREMFESRNGRIRTARFTAGDTLSVVEFSYDGARFTGFHRRFPPSGGDPAYEGTLTMRPCN